MYLYGVVNITYTLRSKPCIHLYIYSFYLYIYTFYLVLWNITDISMLYNMLLFLYLIYLCSILIPIEYLSPFNPFFSLCFISWNIVIKRWIKFSKVLYKIFNFTVETPYFDSLSLLNKIQIQFLEKREKTKKRYNETNLFLNSRCDFKIFILKDETGITSLSLVETGEWNLLIFLCCLFCFFSCMTL